MPFFRTVLNGWRPITVGEQREFYFRQRKGKDTAGITGAPLPRLAAAGAGPAAGARCSAGPALRGRLPPACGQAGHTRARRPVLRPPGGGGTNERKKSLSQPARTEADGGGQGTLTFQLPY